MLSAVAMAALFASCDDEEVIDYSASYPLKIARFYESDEGDMIVLHPRQSTFDYQWHDSSTWGWTGNLKYEYKVPYFILTDTCSRPAVLKYAPVSILIKDSVNLELTYRDGSTNIFQGDPTDYWWEMDKILQ